jgi:dynein heavy chain
MAKICENVFEVAKVLDEFHKFLGPELKEVTGDNKGIDELISRVEGLIIPLESVPFDIFDVRYKTSWANVMQTFKAEVEIIENQTKTFINTSFKKLRSSEGAFDLLQNFQNIDR